MNALLSWFASPAWTPVVHALLHSIWQAGLITVLLALSYRRVTRPGWRHALALGALGGVLAASLVTWAVLCQPVGSVPWRAWLALGWLAGFGLMLARAGAQVAGAHRIRRTARLLDDPGIVTLLAEARKALRVVRRVQLAVTDRLASPAVIGVVAPLLVLPATLVTTLTQEQLRFILLHELAHIRRGDYVAGLFQLLMEAVYFFNPAVWWISQQVRREREASCDSLATYLSGAPAEYARTLVEVAEAALEASVPFAPAFGGDRKPSSLAERVQRLLVPGYRPALRLSWQAMLTGLIGGTALLVLSAVGTRFTVAAVLSAQERADRIERKMAEFGVSTTSAVDSADAPKARLAGRVRTEDGSPLPRLGWIEVYSKRPGISGVSSVKLNKDGTFSTQVPFGRHSFRLSVPGYAPSASRLIEVSGTNSVEDLEVILTPGFALELRVVDSETGEPVVEGFVRAQHWGRGMDISIGPARSLRIDSGGAVEFGPSSESVILKVVANAPGYEITEQEFASLRPGEPLRMALKRGRSVSGFVTSRVTGRPLAGATVRVIFEKGAGMRRYEWIDESRVLGVTDAAGHFTANQLRGGATYWLGISAAGHESMVFRSTVPNESPVTVSVGPELIVRGQVSGDLSALQMIDRDRCLSRNFSETYEGGSHGDHEWIRLRVTNGVGWFAFTNRMAGLVTVSGTGVREKRMISAPVDDWILEVRSERSDSRVVPTRGVVFRFQPVGGLPPRGVVAVLVPDNLDPKERTSHWAEVPLTNGEARAMIAIGGDTRVEPRRTIGFWFRSPDYFMMTNGPGPLVVDVTCLPAGALYAKALNADGTPAGSLHFGVIEVSPAAGRRKSESMAGGSDSYGDDGPRKWISGPLPLGGRYQVYGWRDNAFCLSRVVTLTETSPDAELALQFAAGKTLEGVVLDPTGQPVREVELKVSFAFSGGRGFGLKPVFTDARGRFRLENASPDLGEYSVEVSTPGLRSEAFKLRRGSASPQIIRLERGRLLAGRVVEAGTGDPIPGMDLRLSDVERRLFPMQSTTTDGDGRFAFTSLGDAKYQLFPNEGQPMGEFRFMADGRTNLTVEVKLYEWSKLTPKRQRR